MTMTAREKGLLTSSTDHEWTPEEEIQLFYAMGSLKPIGVNRHFYIACIAERLSSSLNRDYTTESVWIHLRSLYNLDALEDIEPLPFPNEEKEFSLPEAEFSPWLSKKRGASEESIKSCEGPPSIIAIVTDNTTKEKSHAQTKLVSSSSAIIPIAKELDKKIATKLSDGPKRTPKRTRGSMSLESSSPSTTPPPPMQSNKRRRI